MYSSRVPCRRVGSSLPSKSSSSLNSPSPRQARTRVNCHWQLPPKWHWSQRALALRCSSPWPAGSAATGVGAAAQVAVHVEAVACGPPGAPVPGGRWWALRSCHWSLRVHADTTRARHRPCACGCGAGPCGRYQPDQKAVGWLAGQLGYKFPTNHKMLILLLHLVPILLALLIDRVLVL